MLWGFSRQSKTSSGFSNEGSHALCVQTLKHILTDNTQSLQRNKPTWAHETGTVISRVPESALPCSDTFSHHQSSSDDHLTLNCFHSLYECGDGLPKVTQWTGQRSEDRVHFWFQPRGVKSRSGQLNASLFLLKWLPFKKEEEGFLSGNLQSLLWVKLAFLPMLSESITIQAQHAGSEFLERMTWRKKGLPCDIRGPISNPKSDAISQEGPSVSWGMIKERGGEMGQSRGS